MSVASHDFGTISSGTVRHTLSESFRPVLTGLYTVQITNSSNYSASSCIYNYIDNISLTPSIPDLQVDTLNVDCGTGGVVNFSLDAGVANAGEPYWIWMSASGTFPGFALSGVTVPLNMDFLLITGLMNPGFPGSTGFLGVLDGSGIASASLVFPMDHAQKFVGKPLFFAYVLTSAGPSMPLKYASFPAHVKYIP